MKRKIRYSLLGSMLLLLSLNGCTAVQVLETASDKFDMVAGDFFGSLGGEYNDSGSVSIRILTPTPIGQTATSPIPDNSPTPTKEAENGEPKGEEVDEWVYANNTVNIRAGWSTDYKIVGSLQKNDQIHRVEVLENGWSKVCYNTEYAYISSNYLTNERPTTPGFVHLDVADYTYHAVLNEEDVVMLGVKNILQKPELPAGPEITCLTIILQYLEEYVDKVSLAENYLVMAEPGTASPFEAYLGDPKVSSGSYGCYAPVIVDTANRYFLDKGNTKKQAKDVSGSSISELLEFVKAGIPVMVWGTTNLVESKVTAEWNVDGELIQWQGYEHCVVLMGYNMTRSTVIVADPLRGIIEFDMNTFYKRYQEQHKSAVIIVE